MTWEELKEKAKKMGYHQAVWENCITNGRYEFYKAGSVIIDCSLLAVDRTYKQMLMIMRGLE